MLEKIKKAIKNFIHSENFPDFLFAIYFNKKESTKRTELMNLLKSNSNLMDAVEQEKKEHWEGRINKVLEAVENKNIPRCESAGQIVQGNLIMHNNIKVDPLSYYSFPLLKMLIDNKGVHEPEEEKIFQEVTKSMDSSKKMNMLELGSYWSFYSMWFLSQFPTASCFMVEPDRKNLFYGKRNFEINNFKGGFTLAGIGKELNKKQNITTVDELVRKNNISFLDILHSDIQGYELEMLQGSRQTLESNKVGYIFISTHSNDLHRDCKAFLLKYNFTEVANVDLDHSSSWDGILVMKAPFYEGIGIVEVLTKKGTEI